jgi:hypothetical protein
VFHLFSKFSFVDRSDGVIVSGLLTQWIGSSGFWNLMNRKFILSQLNSGLLFQIIHTLMLKLYRQTLEMQNLPAMTDCRSRSIDWSLVSCWATWL